MNINLVRYKPKHNYKVKAVKTMTNAFSELRYFVHLRHKTQLASRFHTFSFLDVVSWDCSLSSCSIFSMVPVWILERQIISSGKHHSKRGMFHSSWEQRFTFVTTMIVSTSPLLNGRSCSDVPLKLYLATHSVPCGHGL